LEDLMDATVTHRPRRLRALLASLATVVALLAGIGSLDAIGAAPASAAGNYSTTSAVNVRSGPGTGYGYKFTAASGAAFTLLCQWQNGTDVNGNRTWDSVRFSDGRTGAITDYATTTPSWNSYAPSTGACPAPTTGTTTAGQRTAQWAAAETASARPNWSDDMNHYWSGWCQAFVRYSWLHAGVSTPSYGSAMQSYNAAHNEGRLHTTGTPSAGASVYYNLSQYGHVAVALGDGRIATTYGYNGQTYNTRIVSMSYFSNYLGWSMPAGQ
jgi:uncharacterized protein YraI